jgi:hypothetical protein
MARDRHRTIGSDGAAGQAALLMLGMLAVLLAGALVLFAFGNALGARAHHQRAADLAAVSAAQVMRDLYPRLFESPFIEPGVPNPRHLEEESYLALAREAAVRGAQRNGVSIGVADVSFPGAGFAPTRVTVRVRGEARVRVGERRRARVPVRASATAELSPGLGADGMPAMASGGGYDGPLAYRQGKPMRPDVALAFDRMAAAAREEAGLFLSVTSGFRSDAEQAVLFAANPDPKWVAPPGESLHRYATELDLGPPGAYVARSQCDEVRVPSALELGALALGLAVSPQIDLPADKASTVTRPRPLRVSHPREAVAQRACCPARFGRSAAWPRTSCRVIGSRSC